MSYGLLGPAILAVVYFTSITIALSSNTQHLPQFPVLKIPSEQYYASERFFIFPVGVAGIILSSGVIRLIAHWMNGEGRFEDHFTLLGFSLIVVASVIGLPDLLFSVLSGIGVNIPIFWVLSGPHIWLGTLWYAVLIILAVKEVESLPWTRTMMLALTGFIVNGFVQFIFIR